ncbi:hypothetical protein V5O48_003996 [Marasmius crinis-equi]|uniref:PHD-type domain-containing protein n=1 Tax=Marasmius crinis-equi TaxID=585013 RepID=A0ABR3FRA7_9AGAR
MASPESQSFVAGDPRLPVNLLLPARIPEKLYIQQRKPTKILRSSCKSKFHHAVAPSSSASRTTAVSCPSLSTSTGPATAIFQRPQNTEARKHTERSRCDREIGQFRPTLQELNTLGQCGIGSTSPQVRSFKSVQGLVYDGAKEKAIQAGAGVTFSTVLCESGRVYLVGSAEAGQLGHGSTGERIITGNKTAFDIEERATLIRSLLSTKITSIVCGNQHTIALSAEGIVYVWGHGGYCRLGLGNQVDQLRPKIIEEFLTELEREKGEKEGSEASRWTMYECRGRQAGRVLYGREGEGSSGSPYTTFRYLADIMACKVLWASLGGVTHWISTPSESDLDPYSHPTVLRMIVSWGQNPVNSELGLGADEPKSYTKPQRHEKLDGLGGAVISVAGAAHTTFFLVKPNPPGSSLNPPPAKEKKDGEDEEDENKFSNLPGWPDEIPNTPDACVACKKDSGDPLECDKCDNPYHLSCLNPPLSAVPEGESLVVPRVELEEKERRGKAGDR